MNASTFRKTGWNFAYLPSAVFLSSDLSHADIRLYSYLLWRQGSNDRSWPKVDTMATDIHMSEQAVRLSLKHLVENNWMRRARNYGKSSDTYIFETQDLCKEFDARSANLLEDDPLTGERMNRSPVSRLNESHRTRLIEHEGAEKPAPSRARPEEAVLLTKFSELAGLPTPQPNTVKERAEAATRWYQPIRRMVKLAGGQASLSLIENAIEYHRRKGLDVSAPASVEKKFISLYGEHRTANQPTHVYT